MTTSSEGATAKAIAHVFPLTSLRFLAAMMVVAHHYWGFEAGYAGVGFFFVLSGYVLALNYPTVNKRDFWWRRFARVYPTHLATLLLVLLIEPQTLQSLAVAVPSFGIAQSWVPLQSVYFAGNPASWSISNEAFFYAMFPFLLGIRGRTLAIWGGVILAFACIWTILFPNWSLREGGAIPLAGRTISTPVTHWVFYIFPPMRLFEFALGMYLATLTRRVGLGGEIAAITLAIVSILPLPLFPPALGASVFFILASAALVYVFAKSDGPVASFLSNPTLVLLGDASFALYLIHIPMRNLFGDLIPLVLVAALAVAVSVIMFRYFEKPVQKWLLKVAGLTTVAKTSGSAPGSRASVR